jgi:hypothetical protein
MPAGAVSWTGQRHLTAFCLGSFQDAACLRHEEPKVALASASTHGSAQRCLLWLGTVLALCIFLGRFLPGIQSEQNALRNQVQPGAVLIQQVSSKDGAGSSIPYAEYRDWKAHRQRFFDAMAFYRTRLEQANLDGVVRDPWLVAHASKNLFAVLGIAPAYTEPGSDSNIPQAFLSPALWQSEFDSRQAILGQVIRLGNRVVRIAGVAPAGLWQLPGHPDLWVLEPEDDLARSSQSASGHVIARLSPRGEWQADDGVFSIIAYSADGDEIELQGVRFTSQAVGPSAIYFFALFLALLALPAITSVFQSESNFASHPPAFRTKAKRCVFLLAKIGLVAALGYFAAVDIAYCHSVDYSPSAEFLQFVASFSISLFGLRWAITDQSRRCPVCLRRVTHPAQVGIASCNFLGWNGTEMICTGGHALLHVPSLPTSWFSRQRWMYLDASWDFLFADAKEQRAVV